MSDDCGLSDARKAEIRRDAWFALKDGDLSKLPDYLVGVSGIDPSIALLLIEMIEGPSVQSEYQLITRRRSGRDGGGQAKHWERAAIGHFLDGYKQEHACKLEAAIAAAMEKFGCSRQTAFTAKAEWDAQTSRVFEDLKAGVGQDRMTEILQALYANDDGPLTAAIDEIVAASQQSEFERRKSKILG